MNTLNSIAARLHNPELAALLIRLVVGAIFIDAGWQKIHMMDEVVKGFAQMGLAEYLAYFVTYFEFAGGMLLVLGVLTRYLGVVFAVIMGVAIWKAHWMAGFRAAGGGYEYVLLLGVASLALAFLGAGKLSIDRALSR